MEFLTLAKMKKLYHSCKTAVGKQTIVFDLSDLDETWFTESVMELLIPQLDKYIGLNSIENKVFCIPVSTENGELSIALEFDVTHVYSKKTGKRLYTFKSVCGFRIVEYKRNIYGVVENGTLPGMVITYGTFDCGWKRPEIRDVEI